MLQAVHDQRRTAGEQDRSRYAEALARHRARVTEARARRDKARAQRRWWAWLRGIASVWNAKRRAPGPPVVQRGSSDQEEILAAGMTGEQMVANELGGVLGDDWVLMRGYRNRHGEIDHLLLGPGGVFAIEVKHRNATVYINGDEWRFDKYDRYGNLVDQGWITDRRGRSPSMQVNESADELEKFLHSRHQPVAIQRVVILTHPRSVLGSQQNLTVRVATSTDVITGLLTRSAPALRAGQLTELERLIEHDHHYHEARRQRRG
jgi:hypothetical protein